MANPPYQSDPNPTILDSARRHGVTDIDILNAYRNAENWRRFPGKGKLRWTLTGPGLLHDNVELGYFIDSAGCVGIFHAMSTAWRHDKRRRPQRRPDDRGAEDPPWVSA